MQLASSFASFLDNPRLSDTKGKSRRGGGGVDEERGRLRRPRVGSSLQVPGEGPGIDAMGDVNWKSNLLHVFATIFIEYVHL